MILLSISRYRKTYFLWSGKFNNSKQRGFFVAEEKTVREKGHDDLKKLVTVKMPYGKYQGRVLADIPENYIVWMGAKGFPEGEIGRLLGLLYEIKLNGLDSLLYNIKKMMR